MDGQRDTELVKQVLAGNADSYGRLVDLHGRAVFAVACSRTGDYTSSEDISQDAFLLAYEQLATLRRPKDFGPWVRAIARNLCRRWQRNRVYRRKLQEDATSVRERLGYAEYSQPLQQLERQETRSLLRSALDALPQREREALLLFYFQRQSVAEAAATAEVSEAAIRKRLQRARAHLRDRMAAQLESELKAVAEDRRLPALVIAGIGAGSTFGKVANAASAAPSGIAWLAARLMTWLAGRAWTPAAGTIAIAALTALAIFAVNTGDNADGRAVTQAPGATVVAESTTAVTTQETQAVMPRPGGASPAVRDGIKAPSLGVPNPPENSASVSGTVREPRGNPVAGAKVEALLYTFEHGIRAGVRQVAGETTSGDDGTYALAGLPATKGRVMIFATGSTWAAGGNRIEPIQQGERRADIDVVLQVPMKLRGQVVDPTDRPVPGATVFVGGVAHPDFYAKNESTPQKPWLPMDQYGGYARTTTDATGRFVFDRVPEGWVLSEVGAFKEGYALRYFYSEEGRKRRELEAMKGTNWSAFAIPPSPGELRIRMVPGAAVSGRVVSAADGQPVPDARVTLEATTNYGQYECISYRALATTDAFGIFRLADIPSDEACLQAHAGSLVSDLLPVGLTLGRPLENVDLAVARPCSIEGTVFDVAAGQPWGNAALYYVKKDSTGAAWLELQTDEHGQYLAAGLPAGNWMLAPRGWRLDKEDHPDEQGMQGITVALESEGVTKHMDLYGHRDSNSDSLLPKITGRVLDASGRPVAGADVSVQYHYGRAQTDKAGRFELARVPSGPQVVKAFDSATLTFGVASIEVPDGQEVSADVVLTAEAARISGRLFDERGQPFRKRLPFQCYPPIQGDSLTSNDDGTYTTGPIEPGEYTLTPRAFEVGCQADPLTQVITVEPGDDPADLNFVLRTMRGFLAGTVTLQDGSPASYVVVTVREEEVLARGRTGPDGGFRVGPIDGEDIRLEVQKSDAGLHTVVEHLKTGTEDLKVVLEPAGIVKGRLVLPGDELKNVILGAYRESSPGFGLTLEGEEFQGDAPAGVYYIHITYGGRTRKVGPYSVTPGATTDLGTLDFVSGTGNIIGAVLKDGRPVPPAEAMLRMVARPEQASEDEIWAGSSAVSDDGVCRLEGLDPGRYNVSVVLFATQGGQRCFSQTVSVSADVETRADFALPCEEATLSGTLAGFRDGESKAVRIYLFEPGKCPIRAGNNAEVDLAAVGALAQFWARPDGTFAGSHLPSGSFEAVAVRIDRGTWTAPVSAKVELSPEKPATVQLALTP